MFTNQLELNNDVGQWLKNKVKKEQNLSQNIIGSHKINTLLYSLNFNI